MVKKEKKKKMDKPILERFNLSYSAYSVWKKSQLLFYLKYLSDIESTDRVNNSYGILGNMMHKNNDLYIETGEKHFDKLWNEKMIEVLVGFNGRGFDKEEYRKYSDTFKQYIDVLKEEKNGKFIVERKISYKAEKLFGITIKGFIDLTFEKDDKVYLLDWKTNTRYNYNMHRDQRLFYSYLMKESLKHIPELCSWFYVKGGFKFFNDSFVEKEIEEFEKELVKMLKTIQEYGDNINKYELGDYNNPFNEYKTLCYEIDKKRSKSITR